MNTINTSDKKLKVITVVGTRPEIIRLSRVIAVLNEYTDHTIVHTGQNYDYELNEVFFTELDIRKPDYFLNAAGSNPAETIGNVIIEADKVFEKISPEALLILGDTNSALVSIAAKRRKIPIFHMEAGNRCFDYRVPEEINRKIVDHISDINLTYSEIAREYLLREGIPADQIIKTGSPMREVLDYYSHDIEKSDILYKLNLTSNGYFLVSAHREENVDSQEKLSRLINILNAISDKYKLPVVVSTHPRTRNRMNNLNIKINENVQFMRPFGFLDYVALQKNARVVLSDSGTITEESSILNFPALNLREVHERPEGFEEAAVMFVGLDASRIFQGIEILSQQKRGVTNRDLRLVADYAIDNVSLKILRIIMSYTNFVNQRVWKKS
ncbi:UDP-N-acetylglucosamine 2-epimerase (non-hydrolyzing) [Escherichia coli]|uniref:non-hydrolyzing UDP-N-acetylglucosamine 2-epimerase n=2 Tax=Escherichia coli TaxID=562 RepID=UPI000D6A3359|nr:UDP-N-acetylglucosamine 2-epimerase (non-hydrolyzing) [Escherichia coli]EAB0667952.1 UDP-N-acetylglucosamine 2-epimerase (non-hydrolyzing) [Escherichia coli]EEV7094844.1 UDP-N-acetylglucosamine 2-epimerase (non-hydrolyzing) [Escherichia coli]EEW2360623.1 UDP-N-acetylglucosamine 2-epimerase (non-hydrolyzing) [Escherichia coli]EEW7009215.1 UDP-N-acetylglucosamine 2-epimerase (non-hydrolyzing) [Escherichia coli]EFA6286543.1 UDP-N-acetylglucosamine 2-epimerase (non-hydrolyzing) [Escherichia col